MLRSQSRQFLLLIGVVLICLNFYSCADGGGNSYNIQSGVYGPQVSGTPDTFRGAGIIGPGQKEFCFGGPLAQCREGDVLLQNDHIRLVIQKTPNRNTGVAQFGGNILDADRFRLSSEPGQDQFGSLFPLINVAWTADNQRMEIINGDPTQGPIKVEVIGILNPYKYIQTNIIAPFAKVTLGVDLFYSDRFDDIYNPFENIPELRNINPIIVTDYTLKADNSYVIIETKMKNDGEEPVAMPFGDWVNGSGTLAPFIPRNGFLNGALVDLTPAFIYEALEKNVGVSYGYFYDPTICRQEDSSIRPTASLTVSGVTANVLCESFLQLIPTGGPQDPKINMTWEPGVNKIRRYFVVGDGDVASVLEGGFKALGVDSVRLTGVVLDSAGQPVERAKVVVLDEGSPVTSIFSDAEGNFETLISSGADAKAQMFGRGSYQVEVYKKGYIELGTNKAGSCSGGHYDSAAKIFSGVVCTLGASSTLSVSALENGIPVPARVTVVGFDPSPAHDPVEPEDYGKYQDIGLTKLPYGIAGVFVLDPSGEIHPKGNPSVLSGNQIQLEPGEYTVFVTHGPEYSVYQERVTLAPGSTTMVHADLTKVLDLSDWVSADGHLHGIHSADSVWGEDTRVRQAAGEDMDVLISTDHDYITNYAPVIHQLGYEDYLKAISGDEITLLAVGHFLAWPLEYDAESTTGGAYDYTLTPEDNRPGPESKPIQSIQEIFNGIEDAYVGDQVITAAHIWDKATGWGAIISLVSSPFFEEVDSLATFKDPVELRMSPNSNEAGGFQGPFPLGTSPLFDLGFNAIELTIGAYPDTYQHLIETALPTYFDFLNLGILKTALSDSDSHTVNSEPIGSPRNYVYMGTDIDSPQDIVVEDLVDRVKGHQVVVSNGVFIKPRLYSAADPQGVTVGGQLTGAGPYTLELEVLSNEFIDWDTVEIYINTQPTPAKDDMSGVTDLSAREFYRVSNSHLPKYLMSPWFSFHRDAGGAGGFTQDLSGGVRRALLTKEINLTEDAWIVVVARGVNTRSAFPYVTKGANTEVSQENFLDTLETDPRQIGGIQPFAYTNPMFIDVAGDGFESLYMRQGLSPLLE